MNEPIRVLVVDDSMFIRLTLARRLGEEPDLQVVGTASDGVEAIERVRELRPDVITLDIEMPRMDGLEALRRIMADQPTPVVMLSTLTQKGARETFKALAYGAVDFVPKPSTGIHVQSVLESLKDKIRAAAQVQPGRLIALAARQEGRTPPLRARVRPFAAGDLCVVVGASTGGPRALSKLFAALPADMPAAAVVVQHMPPHFTASLAERLDGESAWHVKEAEAGDRLVVGQALVAPGGYHLALKKQAGVLLSDAPPRNHVRPSVDVTFEAAARHYGERVVGVILTGMGSDGTAGARRIKAAGGLVLAEAESSCIVYGMPKSVVEAGLADRAVPIEEMASALSELVRQRARRLATEGSHVST